MVTSGKFSPTRKRMACVIGRSCLPSEPPGCIFWKSARPKLSFLLTVRARASPRARVAVVDAEGARFREQASVSLPMVRLMVERRARSQLVVLVSEMVVMSSCLRIAASVTSSSVFPPKESRSTRSPLLMRPRSPWSASVGCRKWLGVPVEANVAEILVPMRPDFPTPETTREPVWSFVCLMMRSTALRNASSILMLLMAAASTERT